MKKTKPACIAILMLIFLGLQSLQAGEIYPQERSNIKELREDLPFYVFEYDLERLYPATWEFYKKLDEIHRDKIYAFYLYDADIRNIRREVFKVALGDNKGKSKIAPFSLSQALANLDPQKSATAAGGLGLHGIVDGPAVGTINLNANSHQSIYSFLENN